MFQRLLFFIFISMLFSNAYSQQPGPELDAVVPFPVDHLQAVEANGQIFFMSKNGRFVFRGQLTDTWHKKTVDTIDEIKYAATHIDVDVMGLPLDKMNTITIKGGSRRVIAFVDPVCPHCKTFIKEALKRTDEYTFKLIVIPALGDESNTLAKSLFCASDKTNALEYYMDQKLSKLPQQSNCDTKFYDLTLTAAQLFEINAVPYFISPDGRYKSGADRSFWQWVKNKG